MQPDTWLIEKERPATVNVPALEGPRFASTANSTTPGPVEAAPAAMCAHGVLLVADQLHPAADCTDTAPRAPAADTVVDVGTMS